MVLNSSKVQVMNTFFATPIDQLRRTCASWLLASSVATLAALCSMPAAANDREVGGVKVSQSLKVGGQDLTLNGAGVRYRGPFKVYTAALYTARKIDTVEAFHADTGAKRLEITMLREVDSSEMGRLFINGMLKNTAPQDQGKVLPDVARMGEVFAAHKRLLPGEQLVIDWLPGNGMQITVRGKAQDDTFKSPAFYSALMNIWLGKSPADGPLKDALLGKGDTDRLARL